MGLTYRDIIMSTSGLLGYWRLDEPSGAVAASQLGGGSFNAGITSIGAYAQTGLLTGDANTCMSFNGTSSVVKAASISTLDNTTYALECLFYNTKAVNSASNISQVIARGATNTAQDAVYILGTGGTSPGQLAVWNGSTFTGSSFISAANTTYHVVFNRNGTAIELYINGANVLSTTVASSYGTNDNVCIGASGDSNGRFTGLIDEAAVYSGVNLDQATVTQHYNASQGIFPASSAVLAQALLVG